MKLQQVFGVVLVLVFLVFVFLAFNQEEKSEKLILKLRGEKGSHLRIATYNLWNVNYHWKLRLDRLKEIVYEDHLDVIALQEVRGNSTYSPMMAEMQRLLPEYGYSHYQPALHRPNPLRGNESEFEYEGVGILSRYKFETLTHYNLSRGRGTDLNVRVVLSAIIQYRPSPSDLYHVGVHVIHWSYDKHQQCQNALATLGHVSEFSAAQPDTILDVMLGDFNIYNEWGAPMEYFHPRSGKLENNCTTLLESFARAPPRRAGGPRNNRVQQQFTPPPLPTNPAELDQYFRDAWTETYPEEKGYTFSTIDQQKGLHVRPDRIIYRATSPVALEDVKVTEDGTEFSMRYLWVIGSYRLKEIAMFLTTFRENMLFNRRLCKQDCGGSLVCHCGVCVPALLDEKGGKILKDLPDCPQAHLGFGSILLLTGVGILSSVIATVMIFVSNSLAKGKGGWAFSLFRKHRVRTLCFSFGVVVLVLAWASLAFVLASVIYPMCAGVYDLAIARVGPDELKTSDHMMVGAAFFFPEL